jgi:hypothetical protein
VVGATPADWLDRFDVQLLVEATSRSPDFAVRGPAPASM